METKATAKTIYTPESVDRIGSVPLAVFLGAADVAHVRLPNGSTMLCTWGRSLSREQVERSQLQQFVHLLPITGADVYEVVLPAGAITLIAH